MIPPSKKVVLFSTLILVLLTISYSSNSNANAYFWTPYDQALLDKAKANANQALVNYRFNKAQGFNPRAPLALTRTVTYSPSGLKNLLKLKSLTPAGLAFGAVLTAAGYLLDEFGNVVTGEQGANTDGGICTFSSGNGSMSACLDVSSSVWGSQVYAGPYSGNGFQIMSEHPETGVRSPTGWSYRIPNYSDGDEFPENTTQPVSDEEFMNDVIPHVDLDDVAYGDDGQPLPTPELVQTLNNLNNWYTSNYEDNSQTTTTSETSNTITNADNSTTTITTGESTIPAFCNWAGILCDFVNWFQSDSPQPAAPDIPVQELDINDMTVDWESGLGTGACPAPLTGNFNGMAFVKDYTEECYAVETVFKPILLFFTLISAFFIVSGVKF